MKDFEPEFDGVKTTVIWWPTIIIAIVFVIIYLMGL